MQIEVSDKTGLLLQTLSKLANISEDQMISQLISKALKLDELGLIAHRPKPQMSLNGGGSLRTREASLPMGLRLRKVFKGQERRARVERDGIHVEQENGLFFSPSLAAVAVTGYNTNGWVFWEYCDERTQSWRPLDEFRRDMALVGYRIDPYDSSRFAAELGICNEWKDGPSRHPATYVVSNPVWRQSRAFCEEHLNNVAGDDPNLRAIWERLRAHQAFHGH